MNLKRQVLFGSLWNAMGSSGQQLISFALFLFIARHVTPADLGIIALALIFVDILGYVSRWGQVETLQRQPELTDKTASTALWMLSVGGLLVTSAIAAGSGPLAGIFGQPALATVLLALAPICALQALNAVPEAIFRRRFDYKSLAMRHWLATLIGGLVGAYLAFRGQGVYALVAQRVVTALVQTFATWAFLRWRPVFAFDAAEARSLARTGAEIMLSGLSGTLNIRISDAIAGGLLGAAALGLMRLAFRFFEVLSQLSATPVSSVALTTLSRLQHDHAALSRAYLRLTQLMALTSLPAFFGLAAIADVLIPWLLGERWAGSVPIIQLLGFLMLAGTVNFFFAPMMYAIDRSQIVLRQSIAQVIATIVLVYVGARFGIVGVMAAYIARALLVALVNVVVMHRVVGLSALALAMALFPPAAACLVMSALVVLTHVALGPLLPTLPLLIAMILAGVIAYGSTLLLGDLVGLWRGYLGSTVRSLSGALQGKAAAAAASPG